MQCMYVCVDYISNDMASLTLWVSAEAEDVEQQLRRHVAQLATKRTELLGSILTLKCNPRMQAEMPAALLQLCIHTIKAFTPSCVNAYRVLHLLAPDSCRSNMNFENIVVHFFTRKQADSL